MAVDNEGFLYPTTDIDACINCNACNQVCPIINKRTDQIPFVDSDFYAARTLDSDILEKSSSGGMFTAIANQWIESNGVIFGVSWNKDEIKHIEIRTADELEALRGAKYAQSNLYNTFKRIKELLLKGNNVLFSGTPCQVDGLKRYLRKTYSSLFTIEVACHGVPSPLVLKKYIQHLHEVYSSTISINFRDKPHGWQQYDITAKDGKGKVLFCENHKDNIYMRGFLHELYSRPSCQACPSKGGSSGADFTICDFWGIEDVCPDFNFESGASLIIANSASAKNLIAKIALSCTIKKVDPETSLAHNGSLLTSAQPHPDREYFFRKLPSTQNVSQLINLCLNLRFPIRLKLLSNAYFKRLKLWK